MTGCAAAETATSSVVQVQRIGIRMCSVSVAKDFSGHGDAARVAKSRRRWITKS
jgi:hypothetical protein